MSRPVIVKARERIAEVARVATGPARRGQDGALCVHPGRTVIAPGLTRRRGREAPPSIYIQLAKRPWAAQEAGLGP